MNELYVDGGVIGHNPSKLGGTWAFKLINYEMLTITTTDSGVITPTEAGIEVITNNFTEMLALIKGLWALPKDWQGVIYSDSQITLGRAFLGWKWKNIPWWMLEDFRAATSRLKYWDSFRWQLLDGHPTKAQLASCLGKRGHPVSKHNVWCDLQCQLEAKKFMEELNVQVSD